MNSSFTVRYYCRAINDPDEKVSRWTDGKRGERLIPRKNLMNDNNNDDNQNECLFSLPRNDADQLMKKIWYSFQEAVKRAKQQSQQ